VVYDKSYNKIKGSEGPRHECGRQEGKVDTSSFLLNKGTYFHRGGGITPTPTCDGGEPQRPNPAAPTQEEYIVPLVLCSILLPLAI
jgi:hypothetical protein